MQLDDVVWQIINQGHCSFKTKTETQTFCRNEYNLTGLCTRSSCPLANSNYATVLQKKGRLYLYMKTIERQHMPAKWWEVVELDRNYAKALEQIDDQLQYWNKFIIHKCKQRVTKLTEMLKRMRRLRLQELPELVGIKKKAERRERVREAKAHIAAKLETEIEQELLERLREGIGERAYETSKDYIANLNPKVFKKVATAHEQDEIAEEDEESLEEAEIERMVAFFSDLVNGGNSRQRQRSRVRFWQECRR